MLETLLLLTVLIASYAATGCLRMYALRYGLIDTPGPRHSHSRPTPHGGGLAIAGTFMIGMVALLIIDVIPADLFAALFGGGFAVAMVGFWDDHRRASARLRIAVHLAAGGWALYWLRGLPPVPLGDIELEFGSIGLIIGTVGIAWLLNLYNFMDGIDGLAAAETITVVGTAGLMMIVSQADQGLFALGVLAASTLGFLPWNWPPARIFMGDVGSGFLGFALAVIALHAAHAGAVNIWAWIILLGAFIVDATVTLIRRMVRGDRWYEPHRSHAYQHAAVRLRSHRLVTCSVAAINLLWLAPLAWLVNNHPEYGLVGTCVALLPLLVLALKLNAGQTAQDACA
jgi:glycosyltransferase WbpL